MSDQLGKSLRVNMGMQVSQKEKDLKNKSIRCENAAFRTKEYFCTG